MKSNKLVFQILLFMTVTYQTVFAQEIPAGYTTTQLADGMYELVADGGGYPLKVIASVGPDGLLIVDSGDLEHGDSLVAVLQRFNLGMPKIIINTHSHIEHIGGNAAIGTGPVIIGHQKLRDRYLNGLYVFTGLPENVLPNVTFTDSMTIFFNSDEIRLLAFPGAHDDSDIIVWFTKSKIVCTGAMSNGHHFPSVDGETGDITRYPETVARVITRLPDDVLIVPGHGDDCSMTEYRDFYMMLMRSAALIRIGLAEDKSLNQLQEEDVLADFSSWESYIDRDTWIRYWVNGIQHPKVVSTKKKVYFPVHEAYLKKGTDPAITVYKDLKTKHSDEYYFDENTALGIGRVLAYLGKNDDSAKFLKLCVDEYPHTDAGALSHYFLGYLSENSGDKKSAKVHYRKYLERFPRDKAVRERVQEVEKAK